MNNFLLKDYRWIEALTESCCESFVQSLKSKAGNGTMAVANLEEELYLWSFYCKTGSGEESADAMEKLSG
jgi:hypothetical protein